MKAVKNGMLERHKTPGRNILLEICVALVLVLIIEYLLREGGFDPFFVSPHPYWIFILLFAVRYGSIAGLVSAIAFSALYILQGQFLFYNGDNIAQQMRMLLKNPLLFVVGGLVIGYFVDEYHYNIKQLNKTLADKKRDLQELFQKYVRARGVSEKLENRLLSEEQTALSLYEAAKKLERLDIEKLYDGVLELLKKFAKVRKASFYVLDNNDLKLKASFGWKDDKPAEFIERNDLLFEEVVEKKKQVTVKNIEWMEAETVASGFLCAFPVILSKDTIFGMIKIEEMDFINVNSTSLKFIQMIVEWAQISIYNAMQYQKQKDKNIEDEFSGAYTFSYFIERLRKEIRLSHRYDLHLSIIRLHIQDYKNFESRFQQMALNIIGLIFKNILRDVDIVAHLKEPGQFAIMLPCTPAENAGVVIERIEQELKNMSVKPYKDEEEMMQVETEVYDTKLFRSNPEDLVEKFNS